MILAYDLSFYITEMYAFIEQEKPPTILDGASISSEPAHMM